MSYSDPIELPLRRRGDALAGGVVPLRPRLGRAAVPAPVIGEPIRPCPAWLRPMSLEPVPVPQPQERRSAPAEVLLALRDAAWIVLFLAAIFVAAMLIRGG
jgi:hypothetical protein